MNIIAENTLAAVAALRPLADLPVYREVLENACARTPPPFGMAWYGEKYRQYAADPYWLCQSLIANAEKEGEGAAKLWAIAGRAGGPSAAIKAHAVDESRHAKVYISMLGTVFPGSVDPDLRASLLALSPGYRMSQDLPVASLGREQRLVDEIVQMNIGEIRTRIHQLLLKPVVLAHAGDETRPRATHMVDALLGDETRHIEYTARLLEGFARRGYEEFIRTSFQTRLQQFNEITLDEVGALVFDGE